MASLLRYRIIIASCFSLMEDITLWITNTIDNCTRHYYVFYKMLSDSSYFVLYIQDITYINPDFLLLDNIIVAILLFNRMRYTITSSYWWNRTLAWYCMYEACMKFLGMYLLLAVSKISRYFKYSTFFKLLFRNLCAGGIYVLYSFQEWNIIVWHQEWWYNIYTTSSW